MKSLAHDSSCNSFRRAKATGVLAALLLFVHGSDAFLPPSHPRHPQPHVLQWIGFQRCQDHRPSPKPLFNSPTKDAYIVQKNREYLIETLGFSEDKVQRMEEVERSGGIILTLDIGVIGERANWLKKRLKLEQHEIQKIAQKQPRILCFLPVTNLAPKLDYLQTRLLLDDHGLKKIFLSAPYILTFSIEESIGPKLDWLQQRLDLDDAAISKIIQKYPIIVCLSIESNLDPKLEWLQQQLDLDDAAAGKMIQKNPNILGLSTEENMEPTLDFYIDALGDEEEALAVVIRNPILFTFSLEKRLKPRLEEIRKAGIVIDTACIVRMGKYTVKQWRKAMQKLESKETERE